LGVTLSPQGAGGQNYHKFHKYFFPSFTALIGDAQTTIAALNNADSGTAKGILEQLNI
jgi:soluble lytic murein transglycosylase-like protein